MKKALITCIKINMLVLLTGKFYSITKTSYLSFKKCSANLLASFGTFQI